MKRNVLMHLMVLIAIAAAGVMHEALAQNPNFPGYLGVYVQEANRGMEITHFIRQTPASRLAANGDISTGDIIVRLAGQNTYSLQQLLQARNRIPYGREGKMVLRSPDGSYYYIWIQRNQPVAAAPAFGNAGRAMAAPADEFRPGGRGQGDNEADIRDAAPQGGGRTPIDSGPDIR
jgi:hypothetical protein